MTRETNPDIAPDPALRDIPVRKRPGPRPMRLTVGPQTFVKKGLPSFDLHDPYYFAVSLGWKRFGLLFLAAEMAINTVFATLYMLQPGSIANPQISSRFLSAFFFSLETLATVGYGEMYPGTLYGHIVSSVEILVGVVFMAIMTGLLFVRFSKPKAKVVYAKHPVVTMVNGQPTLMMRIGNARADILHNANLSLHVLTRSITYEGLRQANVMELPLVRSRIPVFAIIWTLMHVIDEASPLYGVAPDSEEMLSFRFFMTLAARDPAIGQEVSDLHTFGGADLRFGMRYVDAVRTVSGNKTIADYGLLSEMEPDGVSALHPPSELT